MAESSRPSKQYTWPPAAAAVTNWLLSAIIALGVWVLLEQKTRVDSLETQTHAASTDIAVIKAKVESLVKVGERIERKLDARDTRDERRAERRRDNEE